MDLIVLRNVPRLKVEASAKADEAPKELQTLISIDEVRRRWQKKQAVRRMTLSYTPQPA